MDTKGAQLVGSVKQVRFAEVIRAWWVKQTLEVVEMDKRIAAGDRSDLIIGPHLEGTAEAFAPMATRRLESLGEKLRLTSAKYWIEGPEGQSFRINNPRPAARRSYRGGYRAQRSRGICEDAPCCGCCGPQSDNSDHWSGQ